MENRIAGIITLMSLHARTGSVSRNFIHSSIRACKKIGLTKAEAISILSYMDTCNNDGKTHNNAFQADFDAAMRRLPE